MRLSFREDDGLMDHSRPQSIKFIIVNRLRTEQISLEQLSIYKTSWLDRCISSRCSCDHYLFVKDIIVWCQQEMPLPLKEHASRTSSSGWPRRRPPSLRGPREPQGLKPKLALAIHRSSAVAHPSGMCHPVPAP